MFDTYQDEVHRNHKFLAAVHGIDLDNESTSDRSEEAPRKKQNNNFVFGDPADYEKLPEAERVARTQKMMSAHQEWAGNLNINI